MSDRNDHQFWEIIFQKKKQAALLRFNCFYSFLVWRPIPTVQMMLVCFIAVMALHSKLPWGPIGLHSGF